MGPIVDYYAMYSTSNDFHDDDSVVKVADSEGVWSDQLWVTVATGGVTDPGEGRRPSRSNVFIFMQFPLKLCQIIDWHLPPYSDPPLVGEDVKP